MGVERLALYTIGGQQIPVIRYRAIERHGRALPGDGADRGRGATPSVAAGERHILRRGVPRLRRVLLLRAHLRRDALHRGISRGRAALQNLSHVDGHPDASKWVHRSARSIRTSISYSEASWTSRSISDSSSSSTGRWVSSRRRFRSFSPNAPPPCTWEAESSISTASLCGSSFCGRESSRILCCAVLALPVLVAGLWIELNPVVRAVSFSILYLVVYYVAIRRFKIDEVELLVDKLAEQIAGYESPDRREDCSAARTLEAEFPANDVQPGALHRAGRGEAGTASTSTRVHERTPCAASPPDTMPRGSLASPETSNDASGNESPRPLALMHASLRVQKAANSPARAASGVERSACPSRGEKKRRTTSASNGRSPIDSISTPISRPFVTATSARSAAWDTLKRISLRPAAGERNGFP